MSKYVELTGLFLVLEDDDYDELLNKVGDALEDILSPNCRAENKFCAEDCRMVTLGFRGLPEGWEDSSEEDEDELFAQQEAFLKTARIRHHRNRPS